MAAAALIVSILAFGVSLGTLVYMRRQTTATESQAAAARAQDLRDRTPELEVTLHESVSAIDTAAVYHLRNVRPQDLDSVVVLRPKTLDRVHYDVAPLGGEFGAEAEIGPIELGHTASLVLAIGPSDSLPEFRVRVICRSGEDKWESSIELEYPRFHVDVF